MTNIRRIAVQTAASCVRSLEYQYIKLSAMSAAERNTYRRELRKKLGELQRKFAGVETHNAKLVLATFAVTACYSKVFGFGAPGPRKLYFNFEANRLRDILRGRESLRGLTELFWRDGLAGFCSRELFDNICALTVEDQVAVLCDWISGPDKMQRASESVVSWLNRIGCGADAWESYYNDLIAQEIKRWLPSRSRMATLDAEKSVVVGSVVDFAQRMHSTGIELERAWQDLRKLRDEIVNVKADQYGANVVVKALKAGKSLDHVRLEETLEQSKIWGKVLRGL